MSQGALFAEYPTTPSDAEIIGELSRRAYAELPFSMGKTDREELFAGFRNFVTMCSEPGGNRFKEAVTFTTGNKDNGTYHLNYRRPGEVNPDEPDRAPGRDHKYIFHFGSQTIHRATDVLGSLPTEMAEFLDVCDAYYEEGVKTARIGARALALEGVFFNGRNVDNVHHLRIIDYVASPEESLGEAHFDRSVATLALDESDSGLRGVPGQNGYLEPINEEDVVAMLDNLRPIAHYEYVAKFFLSAGINHIPPEVHANAEGLPLLGHDITNDRPGETRQSVVMFLNPHLMYPHYTVPDSRSETGFSDIIAHIRSKAA